MPVSRQIGAAACVDVVYTWVDGADPHYATERRAFASASDKSQGDQSRFRNNGELRYSIRSLLKHTDWVGKIFIVTNNQVPDFIDVGSDKIEIVSVDQIIGKAEGLPSFNSMAIECCLHNIPGLSDSFIYLNDDFFLGRSLSLSELSGSHGCGLFLMEYKNLQAEATDQYQSYLSSSDRALARVYGDFKRFNGCHVPQLFNRDLCAKVCTTWQDEITSTIAHRFRSRSDVVFRLLYAYTVLYERFGRADVTDLAVEYTRDVRFASPKEYQWIPYGDGHYDFKTLMQRVKEEEVTFFCLQDHMWGDIAEQVVALNEFMSSMFDQKADFEL